MRKNYLLSVLSIFMLLVCNIVVAQPNMEVPLDPQLRYGKLENGMTYYIRHNEEPKERAGFYIIQNVGSMLENDDQQGLAHFLEHMAFNGSKHFPKVINTLQKQGMQFGREINAYTTFDETVYNISNVPTTNKELMDTCLLVLNNWSNYLLLTEEEIDKERGVIREEIRTRRHVGWRRFFDQLPVIFKGSKYAERDLLGPVDIINNFEYKTIRDFYHNWYRTDLQAIAIVGDFDVDEMEAKVKELFSTIPAIENPKERVYYKVPDNQEPIFGLVTDPEETNFSVSVMIKHPAPEFKDKNMVYYRNDMVIDLYNTMFRNRITELLQKENPPFIDGRSNYGGFVARTKDFYQINITANPGESARGLEAMLIENERVKRHGFTMGELERAKINMLTNIESAYKKREKRSHDRFCMQYAQHHLTNEPVPGIEFRYQFAQQALPTISLEEINALAPKWMIKENRIYIVSGPKKEDVKHLTKEELFAIVDKVEKMEVEPYVDEAAATTLIEEEIKGGKVITTKEVKELDAVEWTLSNGVKVVYRYSDLNKDQVLFTSYSKGGASQYATEELPSAEFGMQITDAFGVGEFDAITLQKVMTGKKASVRPALGELTEALNGDCVPKDFETLLQLIYLNFEQPRFDETAFNAMMQRNKAFVTNMQNNPQKIMQDSITRILANYHEREQIIDLEYFDKVDFSTIEKVYRDRFQDASDFTFAFVGHLPTEEAKPLIEKYLGALTDIDRTEEWVDHNVDMPEGETSKSIEIKLDVPKSTVRVQYGNACEYSAENKVYAKVIQNILTILYTENIREKEGGTYGVGVGARISHYPKAKFNLGMGFDCDPEKADYLRSLLYKEIDQLLAEGPSQVNLDKVIDNLKKQRAETLQQNRFWLNALKAYYFDNEDIVAPENYEHILDKVTVKDIQDAAKKFFTGANRVEITFRPKAE